LSCAYADESRRDGGENATGERNGRLHSLLPSWIWPDFRIRAASASASIPSRPASATIGVNEL